MSRKRRGGWSWGPIEGAKLRVLSLGAGIQSTTMALMAAHSEIEPMPDLAIMADTGDESSKTMEHLAWLRSPNVLPYPVNVVSKGRLSDSIRARANGQGRFVSAPFYTANGGMGRRQCTREYKVEPLTKEQRALMGFKPRQRIEPESCEIWIGISTDECVRAGAAFERWAVNRYPLLEQRMSRHDCEQWLLRNDYPIPPRSCCVFCPYRTNAEWRWLRDNDPEGWADAVEIDRLIRSTPGMDNAEYLHRDLVPLDEVDLSTDEERGQLGFLNVCEGGCGL